MNWFLNLFLVLLVILALRNAYMVWFQPKKYIKNVMDSRNRASKVLPFIPKIWPISSIFTHPRLDLWWARIVITFIVIILFFVTLISILPSMPK